MKISAAASIALDQLFNRCFAKVGLRKENLPHKDEGLLLVQHLITNYGNHTIPEIDLAFDLAISGQLELDKVESFENFSCLYLSKIINAYRKWASGAHSQVVHEPVESKVFQGEDWREHTQKLLDAFYAGTYKPRLTAESVYDQLVEDFYLNTFAYEAFWENASVKLRQDVQKEMAALKSRLSNVVLEDGSRELTGDYSQHQNLENKLIQYRNGSRDAEVKLLAKQMAVYHYFSYLKVKEIRTIYEPDNTAEPA